MEHNIIYINKSGNTSNMLPNDTKTIVLCSIYELNHYDISEGDIILLESSCSFSGNIHISNKKNFSIGSIGIMPSVIDAGTGNGITLENCENVEIWGLKIKGTGWRESNDGIGISIKYCKNISVYNIESYGFRSSGIEYLGSENIDISGFFAHDNGFCGINSKNGTISNKNVLIRHSKAFDNAGDPDNTCNHSGSGIGVFHTYGGTVKYCEAAGNGWAQRQNNINGPVGIWCACDCKDILFEKNISRHNRTQPGCVDGDGFDIDGAVVNGTMRYNYSYQNEGSGYLLCEYGSGMEWKNNNMEYCVSIDDSKRVLWQGSLTIYGPDWLCLDGSLTDKCLFIPAPGRHAIVNQELGSKSCDIEIKNTTIIEGTEPAIQNPKNPNMTIEDTEIIKDINLYHEIMSDIPRLTNPRDLDKIEVFNALKDGTCNEIIKETGVKSLFETGKQSYLINDYKMFTYELDGGDFCGSDIMGDVILDYDSIKPGTAIRLKNKGSMIKFNYPSCSSSHRHLISARTRLQSPDTEAYLFVADGNKIVKAVAITGGVSDYNIIQLEFNGFVADSVMIGILHNGGNGSCFVDKIYIYQLKENSPHYDEYPLERNEMLNAFISSGDVYTDENNNIVLNKPGSEIHNHLIFSDNSVNIKAKIEAVQDGGLLYIQCNSNIKILNIKSGVSEYELTLSECEGFARYGIFNTQQTIKVIYFKKEVNVR